jgi:peroxiredoxin
LVWERLTTYDTINVPDSLKKIAGVSHRMSPDFPKRKNRLLLKVVIMLQNHFNIVYSFRLLVFFCLLSVAPQIAFCQFDTQSVPFTVTDPADVLVPQTLLPTLHAAEVQADLGLKRAENEKLEAVLAELDQRWWPSRILEREKSRLIVAELEVELLRRLAKEISADQIKRLQVIELQSQGPRMMLRPDVAKRIGLSPEQQKQFRSFAENAEKKYAELNREAGVDEQIKKKLAERTAAVHQQEIQSGYAILNETQKKVLAEFLGKMLDFSQMERLYAIAPELIDSGEWVGTPITSLRALKGKVVVVHFYAFQCINCRNNFSRYNQWFESFKDQDVIFLGIQTPETNAEADPDLVREAAQRDKFQFPVLIDLGKKNWTAWGNTMWPTVYVIDKRGYIRVWWQGELNWQGAAGDKMIADTILKLLKE